MPRHAPASGKTEQYNGLLKTTLKALGGGTVKNGGKHLAQATWLVHSRGSINQAGPAQSDFLHAVEGDKVPVMYERNMLGKTGLFLLWATANPSVGFLLKSRHVFGG